MTRREEIHTEWAALWRARLAAEQFVGPPCPTALELAAFRWEQRPASPLMLEPKRHGD